MNQFFFVSFFLTSLITAAQHRGQHEFSVEGFVKPRQRKEEKNLNRHNLHRFQSTGRFESLLIAQHNMHALKDIEKKCLSAMHGEFFHICPQTVMLKI